MEELKNDILGALARGYCYPKTSHLVLDGDLIEAMAKEVLKALVYNKMDWLKRIAPKETQFETTKGICDKDKWGRMGVVMGRNACIEELFFNAEQSLKEGNL